MVVGVVLAAGASLRMGAPKALLEFGNTTFIRHILDVYRQASIEKIVVVLPPSTQTLRDHLAELPVKLATNENPESGQLSSVIAGLIAAEEYRPDGVLLHPVDHPAVSLQVINSLLTSFRNTPVPIIIPTCNGKRGHPVLFSSAMFRELRTAPLDVGARFVVRNHTKDVLQVETYDRGVLLDVDTPSDYEFLKMMLRNEQR
jgi:molybdenum cofactor cytidylyltransferase